MNKRFKIYLITFFWLAAVPFAFGQPGLSTFPDTLNYESPFERLQNLYIYNSGTDTLRIDSIFIDESLYDARFDRDPVFPLILSPSDTLLMDCILWNYWSLNRGYYDNTIIVYNNSQDSAKGITIRYGYDPQNIGSGIVQGFIKSNESPVSNAKVLFYSNGTLLLDSVSTNENGFFNITLIPGFYLAAAEKEGYYLSYYSERNSPIDADFFEVNQGSLTSNLNFDLRSLESTSISIRGNIFDREVNALSKKKRSGVVVARRGNHNNSKVSGSLNNTQTVFTGLINSDGSYEINNITSAGHYYIQAISELFLPGYYSAKNEGVIFWQKADSVFIDSEHNNLNISLERDSSYGGGTISGKVEFDTDTSFNSVVVYAQSVENNAIYTHNYVDANGNYRLPNLPIGTYRVIAQLIGFDDAVSLPVAINWQFINVQNVDITLEITDVEEEKSLPNDIKLHQNYPNPFNPETVISYDLPSTSFVSLKIYNILGSEVVTLVNEDKPAGAHQVTFNASSYSSGIYFYKLQSGKTTLTKKMILMK